MSKQVDLLKSIIRKVVKEELKKNFRSMMLETIGEMTLQNKSISFLSESPAIKPQIEKNIVVSPPKEEIRKKLLERLSIPPEMTELYEDVSPINATAMLTSNVELPSDDDGEGVDPSMIANLMGRG